MEDVWADLRADSVAGAEILVDPDHRSGVATRPRMRGPSHGAPSDLDDADAATVLQLTDTHLLGVAGLPGVAALVARSVVVSSSPT